MMFKLLRLVVPVAIVWVAATEAFATSVSPINIEMVAAGPRARAHIVVTNTSRDAIAIEPDVARLVLDQHGKSTSSPSSDEFLTLPTQALIAPGSSQTFRLQWLGDPALSESRSYLVAMNQLPVRGLKSKAGLQILVSFGVAVNVAPAQGRGAMRVASSGLNGRKPFVVIENPTAVHALLRDAEITLQAQGWSTTLPPGALENVLGTGLVQPKRKRSFQLPVDVPSSVRQLTVAIDYRAPR